MNKAGFLLFESIIYIALSFIILIFVFSNFIFIERKINQYVKEISCAIDFSIAFETIERDLMHAISKTTEVDLVNKIFKIYEIDNKNNIYSKNIGWYIKNNKLIRMFGDYNFQTKQWQNKIESPILNNLNFASINLEQDHSNIFIKSLTIDAKRSL